MASVSVVGIVFLDFYFKHTNHLLYYLCDSAPDVRLFVYTRCGRFTCSSNNAGQCHFAVCYINYTYRTARSHICVCLIELNVFFTRTFIHYTATFCLRRGSTQPLARFCIYMRPDLLIVIRCFF